MNTRFSYLYEDGSGHRYFAERVFAGTPEPELLDRLRRAMEPGDGPGTYRFIAEQVGLPSMFPWVTDTPGTEPARFRPAQDPPWHEVNLGEGDHVDAGILVSDDEPTDGRSFEQFVRAVEQARAEGWHTDEVLGAEVDGKLGRMESVRETRD